MGAVVKLNLKDLLKRALLVGAKEVRLVPGRRTIVITDTGENEVRGDTQTPERINAMLEPILTSDARRSLAGGWADWTFDLPGHGLVHATAELKMGLVHAHFDLAGGPAPATAASPEELTAEPEPPRILAPSPPKRMQEHAPMPHEATRTVVTAGGPPPFNPTQPSMRQVRDPSIPPVSKREMTGPSGSTEAIDRLLRKMVEIGASDLHICVNAPPMFRLDGDMVPVAGERVFTEEAANQILRPMMPRRNLDEFDETHDTDFAHEIEGVARFRSNVFMDLGGIGGVFRVIPSKILSVEQLGLPTNLLSLCNLAKGLVVVTGPTGSGKSTTLAALIDYINANQKKHIITIEDPVEFVHPNK
jgi:twitching motility protein PilT